MNNSFSQQQFHFQTGQQQFWKKIQFIEKQLNNLCCLHDSLMPILDIGLHQSVITRWQSSLRNIQRKINDFEGKIGILVSKKNQIRAEGAERNSFIEKINRNIQEIKANMSKINEITYQNQNISNSSLFGNQISNQSLTIQIFPHKSHYKKHSEQLMMELQNYINTSLALFKNSLLQQQTNSQQQFEDSQKQIADSYVQSFFFDIRKQIQGLRKLRGTLQLQKNEQYEQKFYLFIKDKIKISILQIHQILFNIAKQKELRNMKDSALVDELKVVGEKVKLVNWQIKGLKKKYLFSLHRSYKLSKDRFEVNEQQKKIAEDLTILDEAYSRILVEFQQLAYNQKLS